jgi:hypothetical protein
MKVSELFFEPLAKDNCKAGVFLATVSEMAKTSGVFYNERMQIVPFLF